MNRTIFSKDASCPGCGAGIEVEIEVEIGDIACSLTSSRGEEREPNPPVRPYQPCLPAGLFGEVWLRRIEGREVLCGTHLALVRPWSTLRGKCMGDGLGEMEQVALQIAAATEELFPGVESKGKVALEGGGLVHFAWASLLDIFYLVCAAPRFFANPAGHDLVVVRNNENELVGVLCTERPEVQQGEG